jgi:hypothetical protein
MINMKLKDIFKTRRKRTKKGIADAFYLYIYHFTFIYFYIIINNISGSEVKFKKGEIKLILYNTLYERN